MKTTEEVTIKVDEGDCYDHRNIIIPQGSKVVEVLNQVIITKKEVK